MLQSNEYFSEMKSIGFTSSSIGRASVGVMAEGSIPLAPPNEEMTVVSGALSTVAGELSNGKCMQPVFNVHGHSASFIYRSLSPPRICAAIWQRNGESPLPAEDPLLDSAALRR